MKVWLITQKQEFSQTQVYQWEIENYFHNNYEVWGVFTSEVTRKRGKLFFQKRHVKDIPLLTSIKLKNNRYTKLQMLPLKHPV